MFNIFFLKQILDIMNRYIRGHPYFHHGFCVGDELVWDDYGKHVIESQFLALGDNVEFMNSLISRGYRGSFRLIYIDPPFFTKSKFNASVSIRAADGSLD